MRHRVVANMATILVAICLALMIRLTADEDDFWFGVPPVDGVAGVTQTAAAHPVLWSV